MSGCSVSSVGEALHLCTCRADAQPVLCAPPVHSSNGVDDSDGSDVAALEAVAGDGAGGSDCTPPGAAAGRAASAAEHVPHTYDDADLYEQLLKAFLDAAAPGAGIALQKVGNSLQTQGAHVRCTTTACLKGLRA